MSAKTAPGSGSLPQRSSSSISFAPNRPVGGRPWADSAGCRRSPAPRRRRRVADQSFLGEPADHRLLHVELGHRAAGRQPLADEVERAILDAIQPLRRRAMRLRAARRSRSPRTAAPDRRTRRPRRRAGGPPRPCPHRPAKCRGWRCPANTPSPPASCPRSSSGARPRAARVPRTAASPREARRDCDARSRARVPAGRPSAGIR